jgi:hypothetical protein
MLQSRLSLLLVLLMVLATAPPADAAPVAAPVNATGSARLIRPLSLIKVADLDFGGISALSAGTVILDPHTNNVTRTGGLIAAGGAPRVAVFMGAAARPIVVNIRIPRQAIALTRAGGTETLTVSNWTLQGQSKRELAAQTTFTFGVGATLTVPANPVEGEYRGTFDIEVQYP